MGENKSIHAYHDREHDVFILSNFECLQMHIACFRVTLGIELNPAAITCCHRILLVIPDINGGGYGAIDARHNNRETHPGDIEEHLDHEQKSLRGSGGVCPCPCRARPKNYGCSGMFTLHVDIF